MSLVRRAPGRVAAVLAALLVQVPRAASQAAAPETGASDRVTLEIVKPLAADMPVGPTAIRVLAKNARPGDTMDFFVDGRKIAAVAREPWEALWDADPVLRPHVLTVALLRDGREIATARLNTRNPGFTARAEPLVVALAPVVTDGSGNYVLGLARDDFHVFDDGRPQKIETFESVDSPLASVLVLDTSASMQPKLDEAKRAVLAFLEAFKADDRVGLLVFNSGIESSLPPTLDRKAIAARVSTVQSNGETALYDAVAAALRELKRAKQRRAVVVFTDGEDNRSRLSVNQAIEIARSSEVSIYTVAQGTAEGSPVSRFLERLATETGGRAFRIEGIRNLSNTFGVIVKELRSQYFLTYTPSVRGPRTWHTVDVRVDRRGATVRAKKRYFSP